MDIRKKLIEGLKKTGKSLYRLQVEIPLAYNTLDKFIAGERDITLRNAQKIYDYLFPGADNKAND